MCTLCAMTATFDPLRHPGGPESAIINEGTDAPSGPSTPYTMTVGDTFNGTIEGAGASDWIRIDLTAGTTYTFDLRGAPSGSGTLSDPLLVLYSSGGSAIASNDDGGTGLESRLTFTASSTGTYYIGADAFGVSTGTYQLSVSSSGSPGPGPGPTPTPPGGGATLDELADYLQNGYWNDTGRSARSFSTATDNVITVNLSGLTAAGQQLARWALEAWELVADLQFQEVSGVANITFDDNQSGAFARSFTFGQTISRSEVNISTSWIANYGTTIDSYSFQTYVHEIGHALGLGHQGNYNGSARYGTDETFSNDSWQMSVMSYFNQSQNTTTNASRAFLLTTMMSDIVAIQNMYGAPSAQAEAQTGGDTTWGANSNLGGYLGAYFSILDGGPSNPSFYGGADVAFTIYDSGGFDTFDVTFSNTDNLVDLREERFSNIDGLIGNVGIARGTVIERAVTGSGDDTVIGNGAANRIFTNDGADSVNGGAGADTIKTGAGNDTINGGTGADSLVGQGGNDIIEGGSAFDILRGDDGNDSLTGGTGDDTLYGGAGNDTIFGNTALDTIYGGAGDDSISSGDGVDLVYGDDGNDTIFGRSGWDSLFGGNGNDSIVASEGDDLLSGGAGDDWLSGGSAWDTLFGNEGNDTIYGNFGSDVISGGDGMDELYGGTGDDTIRGLAGNDTIQGNQGVDRIEGGSGNDLLRGGTQRDTFVFNTGHDTDIINDFEAVGRDILLLSTALTGGLTDGQAIIDTYGSISGGFVVFNFGGGDIIQLTNLTSFDELADNISTFS